MQFAKHIENSAYLKGLMEDTYKKITEATQRRNEAIDLEDQHTYEDREKLRFYWQIQLNNARSQWEKLIKLNDAELLAKAFNTRYKTTFQGKDIYKIIPSNFEDRWKVYTAEEDFGILTIDFLTAIEKESKLSKKK